MSVVKSTTLFEFPTLSRPIEFKKMDSVVRERSGVDIPRYCAITIPQGLKATLTYNLGVLTKVTAVLTDGQTIDISRHLSSIGGVPFIIRGSAQSLTVTGVLYIQRDCFHDILTDVLMTGNIVSSFTVCDAVELVVNTDDQAGSAIVGLRFKPISCCGENAYPVLPDSVTKTLSYLRGAGFVEATNDYYCANEKAVEFRWRSLEVARSKYRYEVAGLLAVVDYVRHHGLIGSVDGNALFGAMLSKEFPGQLTDVDDVEFAVMQDGAITPVLILKPIKVQGAFINEYIVSSMRQFVELGLANCGQVAIMKDVNGDLQITGTPRNEGRHFYRVPTTCPSCSGKLMVKQQELHCGNGLSCPAQLEKTILSLFGPNALNVPLLNSHNVRKLIDLRIIENPKDIFSLKYLTDSSLADILFDTDKESRTRSAKLQKLFADIERSRMTSFKRVIVGLNIDCIGPVEADTISRIVTDFTMLGLVHYANVIRGFLGETVSSSLHDWMQNENNRTMLSDLVDPLNGKDPLVYWVRLKLPPVGLLPLHGLTFYYNHKCGFVDSCDVRSVIRGLGGEVVNGINDRVDIAIIEDPSNDQQQRMIQYGIDRWGCSELMELFSKYTSDIKLTV
jgi:NAD-dependent DNA ligase